MARENVSFTRYYYKVLIEGGNWRVHQKARPYNSGSMEQDALPGPLHLLIQIVAIPPKILKWPEKKKPNFYSPPPHPHTHTYLRMRNTHRYLKGIEGSVFEKCFLSEVITPSLQTQNLPPYPPQKYIRPPTPYPLPLCVLYHNIDSSDQWRVQGDSGGSLWTKIITFSWRFFRKTIR